MRFLELLSGVPRDAKAPRATTSAVTVAFALALFAVSAAPRAAAQSPALGRDGLHLVQQIGGATRASATDGLRVFVGEGPRVVAYRIEADGRLARLGHSGVLPGIVRDIELHPEEGLLAAATGAGGVWLLDAVDEPRVIGGAQTQARFFRVAWSGSWLVAGALPDSISLFERENGQMTQRDTWSSGSPRIFDLAETTAGVLVLEAFGKLTTLRIGPSASLRASSLVGFVKAKDAMDAHGALALAVGPDSMNLVDVDPDGTTRITRGSTTGADAVALTDQSAWIAKWGKVRRIHRPSSENLRPLSHGADAGWLIATLAATDDDRYAVAAGPNGIATFERTDDGVAMRWNEERPDDWLQIVGTRIFNSDGPAGPGQHVVLAHDGKTVWGFAEDRNGRGARGDLGAPTPLFEAEGSLSSRGLAVWHDQLYVADEKTVHVLDLSTSPLEATPMTELLVPEPVHGVWADGGLLSATITQDALYYQLSDDGPPMLLDFQGPVDASWDGPGYYTDAVVDGGLLAGALTGLMEIVDMSDPVRPKLLARSSIRADLSGSNRGLTTRGMRFPHALEGRMLARSIGTSLVIQDLSNPANPKQLSRIDMPEAITDVVLVDGFVYVTVVDHGVFRFDLRLPEWPGEAGWLRLRDLGESSGLAVMDDRVYIGGGTMPRTSSMPVIVGAWGVVVAEIEEAVVAPSPTATQAPRATPTARPTPSPGAGTPSATATARITTPTPRQMLLLPWLLQRHAGP